MSYQLWWCHWVCLVNYIPSYTSWGTFEPHTEICCSAQADWLLWTLRAFSETWFRLILTSCCVFLDSSIELHAMAAPQSVPGLVYHFHSAMFMCCHRIWQWPKCYMPLQLLLPPVLPFCYYWPGFTGITGWVANSSKWLVTDSPIYH